MTKTSLNPARAHHVHQIRSSLLQDLVSAAPLALQWNNRYVLVRPDGKVRTYEPVNHTPAWSLRDEAPLDEQMSHVDLAMLCTYGQRVDPVQVELPALSHDQQEQVREWWTAASVPAPAPMPPMTDNGILPIPLSIDGADRYVTDPSLLATMAFTH